MDILKIIKTQICEISNGKELIGLNSVLTHIERAEYLLEQGIQTQDEANFTDVIYRTNQAFEGMLKEAYSILSEKSDTLKLTPFKIEKYLTDNNIFNERVLEQFTNYRKKWRNPSTHNHKLFFRHSEAFLAIISVSAFIHLLLNQIVEKNAFDSEIEKLIKQKNNIKKLIVNYDSKNNLLRLSGLLVNFTKNTPEIESIKNEYELFGMIQAYIETGDDNFNLDREPVLLGNQIGLRPDFIVNSKDDKIVIEVKRNYGLNSIKNGENQLLSYLEKGNIKQGILYVAPVKDRHLITIDTKTVKIEDKEYDIVLITPKNKNSK